MNPSPATDPVKTITRCAVLLMQIRMAAIETETVEIPERDFQLLQDQGFLQIQMLRRSRS